MAVAALLTALSAPIGGKTCQVFVSDLPAPPSRLLYTPQMRQCMRSIEQPFQIGRVCAAAPDTRNQIAERLAVLLMRHRRHRIALENPKHRYRCAFPRT